MGDMYKRRRPEKSEREIDGAMLTLAIASKRRKVPQVPPSYNQ